MVEEDLSWMKAHPDDHLASVVEVSGGGQLNLTGAIAAFEGQSMIALVNVSQVGEPLVLQKWFEAGGGVAGVGKLDVLVEIPESVKAGDCLAVKNVSGGRGFTDDEVRVKQEFGAFLYAFTDGDGQSHPTGTTGPKVFGATAKCLEDAAANRAK